MELCLFLLVPALAGALLAVLLTIPGRRLSLQYPWPLWFFLASLGAAANNTAAVWFAGGEALLPSPGGFLGGDSLTASLTGALLGIFSLSGAGTALLLRRPSGGIPGPAAAWTWAWILSQGALSAVLLLLGAFLSFRTFPDGQGGLPLSGYLLLLALLCPGLGCFWGRRWGRGYSAPLAGTAAVCALTALLAALMISQARYEPLWGLDLIQSPAGTWFARLALPAALLLGDYQYAWDISAPGILLSALAPHLLFSAGYLLPQLRRSWNLFNISKDAE